MRELLDGCLILSDLVSKMKMSFAYINDVIQIKLDIKVFFYEN